MKRWLVALSLFVAAPAEAQPRQMVAAAHPLAVAAGVDVLNRGGSALDAAVAVQMVLGVVEPHASGIGGGGFLLHYEAASRSIAVYDGRETAPAGAAPRMFLGPYSKAIPFREAVASGIAVGVPGTVSLLEAAHKDHGKLAWRELFGPAISTARDGFAVSPRLANWLRIIPSFAEEPAARALYYNPDGTPRRADDRIVNLALAETLDRVSALGARALLEGEIATEMVTRVRTHIRPGWLSLEDLAGYRVVKREALCGPYRVWLVCGMPPPSSGGVAVLQMLALLEPFDLAREAPNSLRALHLIAEAGRLAFADRDRYLADPAFVDVPVKGLLAPAYLAERRKLISPDRSMGPQGRAPEGYPERGTSHITIVDRQGNAVAFTTTIEAPFGSQMMVRGFLLNNELTDFSALPERDGRLSANRVQGGKRPRSSMSPTLVLNADRSLAAALGSAGGARIIGDTLHALIGMLDWNLSPQAAVDQPRLLNMNGATELEDKAPLAGQADGLRALGHDVQLRRHEGGLTAIRRTGDGWQGAADPRRDGVARGE